jgi:predicted RNase H-like HicB family nuclease
MKQYFHTIFRPDRNGWFVGWVEEIPGTITYGKSLDDCRRNLEDALRLMLETHRDEARRGLAPGCIEETMEIECGEEVCLARQVH